MKKETPDEQRKALSQQDAALDAQELAQARDEFLAT